MTSEGDLKNIRSQWTILPINNHGVVTHNYFYTLLSILTLCTICMGNTCMHLKICSSFSSSSSLKMPRPVSKVQNITHNTLPPNSQAHPVDCKMSAYIFALVGHTQQSSVPLLALKWQAYRETLNIDRGSLSSFECLSLIFISLFGKHGLSKAFSQNY